MLSINVLARKVVILLVAFSTLLLVFLIYFYMMFVLGTKYVRQKKDYEFEYIKHVIEREIRKIYGDGYNLCDILYSADSNHYNIKNTTYKSRSKEGFLCDAQVNDYNLWHNKTSYRNKNHHFIPVNFNELLNRASIHESNISSTSMISGYKNTRAVGIDYEYSLYRIINFVSKNVSANIYFSLLKNNKEIMSVLSATPIKKSFMHKSSCSLMVVPAYLYNIKICSLEYNFLNFMTNILCFGIIAMILSFFYILHFIYKNLYVSLVNISQCKNIGCNNCNIVEINNIVKLISTYSEQLSSLTKFKHQNNSGNLNNAKSEFLSCVTHELRNPLNIIISSIGLMKFQGVGNQHSEYCAIIDRNAQDLLNVIDNMLEVSRVKLGISYVNKSHVNLASLLRNVIDLHKADIVRKEIAVEYYDADAMPNIFVDKNKIKRAFDSIISNAIKFNVVGGLISIGFDYCKESGVLILTISDNGVGIKENQIRDIFEDFKQLDSSLSRQFSGVGTGLFLAKKFITMNDGSIEIASTFGKGTTAIIKFIY